MKRGAMAALWLVVA